VGTASGLGMAGTRLSVLSLTAEGALAVEQVVVPVGATAAALGTGAGAVYVLMEGSARKAEFRGFKPFTEGNFRENLARLTGRIPEDAHAHHVFPVGLAEEFQKLGINVHDPRFGAWWNRSGHLKKAYEYSRQWEEFLSRNPSLEQVLQFGRELGRKYGFQVNY